jgi:lysophospholipase L1-like esterase
VRLHISVPDTITRRLALYGIELMNTRPGIIYHSVGSNGITYEAFVKSINYLPMLKQLQPDCIIISLGTNDSYKRSVDTMVLKKRIITVIDEIKKELPGTCIMLTTPGDHLLEKTEPNPNLIKTHDAVLKAAIEEKCVFWDFFEVMGGLYSSKRWDKEGLMYKDLLHFNKEGYKLQGDLFYEALAKALKN